MKKESQLAKIDDQFELVTKDQVKQHICKDATDQEIAYFLEIAKLNKLNPFKREIYLVKYPGSPANTLTGYEVYLKRAERTGNLNGFKVWTEGEGDRLVAKIEIQRKDWDQPFCHQVEYVEYVGRKKDGTPTRFWKEKPKTMIKKVVMSQGFRLAFPDELGGMPYTRDEIDTTAQVEVVPDKPAMPKSKGKEKKYTEPKDEDLEPAANAYKEMLLSLNKAKAHLGEKVYYRVLGEFGYTHANQIKSLDAGDDIIVALRKHIGK